MHPPSDTARQNARRRPDLNINTAAAGAQKPSSSSSRDAIPALPPMPQTPPSRKPPPLSSKGKSSSRALRLPTTTTGHPTGRDAADIETFLESITPVDMSNKENDRPEPLRPNPRDSHDLSLSPRQVTRDSLVTNMLLSLDQFSMGQANGPFGSSRVTYDDPSLWADDSRAMTFASRPARGNGHSYSYSSDFEGADDSSRVSSQPSRGRRSNSSSGFQSNLGRINSMRETSRQPSMAGGRALHSRSGKTSKSSSINSIDQGYAQVLSSQRWAQGFGGRSSSFDYGQTAAAAPNVPTTQPSPWHIEFSNSFFNEDYEAAPTPTVPGGPRRLATVPSLPVLPPPPPPEPPTPERKRSTRSSRSATVGGRRPDSKANASRDVPPVPTLDLDSAPAPHVGYEKSKEAVHGGPNATSQPPKDKPGFFRRMFGSSRNNLTSPSALENSGSSPYVSSTSVETTASRSLSKSSAPPSRESHHSTTHTIQKKTSSFFRRRKQSFTETEPPPPLPISAVAAPALFPPDKDMLSPRPEPSPITSLRRAMDPYLHGSGSNTPHPLSPESTVVSNLDILTPRSVPLDASEKVPSVSSPREQPRDAERPRNVRGFSPDYEPGPKAVIRTVEPASAEHLDPSPKLQSQARMEIPNRQPPKPPVTSSSFLADNSDSESSPRQQKKDARAKQSDRKLRPEPSDDRRAPSPSPSVVKSKSSPNLGRARAELAVPNRRESKLSSASSRGGDSTLALPIEGVMRDGSISDSKSAISVPSVKIDSADISPKTSVILKPTNQSSSKLIDEPHYVMGDPTEDDRQKAQGIFDGNEDFIQKEKAASWMGEEGPVRQRTLLAYMDLYDFNNQSIVTSLRQVCGRLVLRAETQQVDRILVAFSRRWCDCNPNHGFKAMDIIHTICYSIMLLNTDLHMAEIESKMTRSQFIKNTMTTIKQALEDSAPDAFQRPSILPDKGQSLGVDGERPSGDYDRRSSFRASFKPPPRSESALGNAPDQLDSCGPLVKNPFDGNFRGWEGQVEIVLKETYASIRDERLPLFGAESNQMQNQGGLSVMNMLKRTPSVLSKAPSETLSTRGRIPETAKAASRWTSKSRSRPRGFGGNGFSSSRTSFDDGNSIWSPTESSATWSRYSLGRTHTSMSIDSFGSSYPRGDYQQSIGFANALSQAITRDEQFNAPSILSDELKSTQLLEDESLELAGPPWVKEGIVTHKHHLDGIDKKAKDRNWNEVFAVVQKGQISLFSFSPNKSLRKGRSRGNGGTLPKGAVVGGGNWQENATNVGTFSLRQTLASALPPPGYSRSRPHVWALSLPTGAVHLFQVGTPEICKEFVNTANYWSARLSTHPLVGGISNIEYGWSDAIVQNSLVTAINESTGNLNGNPPGTGVGSPKGHSRPGSAANAATMMTGGRRGSVQSRGSVRSSSFDFPRPGSGSSGALGSMGPGALTRHGKLPGDKIHIAEWAPPQQSMRPSNMNERDQLDTLLTYVRGIEEELQTHNSLRSPMLLAFTPRGNNATKAMANWQRRSEYLLREIVKFRTYVDGLQAAEVRKNEIYSERETARRAANGEELGSLEGDDGSLEKVLSGEETEHERSAPDEATKAH
ncbi:hypothetical protein GQ53DRAFT_330897 [Thozetella sp. PMI_491]|nr:hypothetical protein GQ53DRAFT_330897 [Thozetella sp. PMI_491]